MRFSMVLVISSALLLLCTSSADAKTASKPVSPTPAPAPAPDYVNLTDLFSVAGPFHTFLGYLESTKVIETFQNQANNTEEGITIFVPKDSAFSALKKGALSNLTDDQIKSLMLFHALPHFYSLSDFKSLSAKGPVSTFAGQPSLNFDDDAGTIHINSNLTETTIISAVHSTAPVSVFEVSKVLLPQSIFGTEAPLAPAPAPAPSSGIAPVADADAPVSAQKGASSPKGSADAASSSTSSSPRRTGDRGIWVHLSLAAVCGAAVAFLS